MSGRVVWVFAAAAIYGLLLAGAGSGVGTSGMLQAVYGTAYFMLGVLILGAVARFWVKGAPALWRPAMLGLGALAAVLEIWLWPGASHLALVDRWMLALLGLLAAAILVRIVPEPVKRAWLGLDRRRPL